jgi:hypothetical protein
MQAYADSIIQMIDRLNMDFDRFEELKTLRDTPRFVAGWNMPGYMPDSEPAEFDDVRDACQYISDEIDDATGEKVEITPGEFGQTIGAYHYWVTQDGNMLPPDDADELEELTALAGDCQDEDEARDALDSDPLCVEFRSGWESAGSELTASEFRIVLATGGPHVEIIGELDHNGYPHRAWMQYRNWGESGQIDIDRSYLLAYASHFIGG